MAEVADISVPSWVFEGDVDRLAELADLDVTEVAILRALDGQDRRRRMIKLWFQHFHSSRREAKRLFVLVMREAGIPFRGEDVETVTGRPPVETQS